jgi:hypothetical protein
VGVNLRQKSGQPVQRVELTAGPKNWHMIVISKVRRWGGENGQFRHIRAWNESLGMKISQKEVSGTQTSFSTNFGGKLSFILWFLFPERPHYYIRYFHCSYLYDYYNYSQTLCIKWWFSGSRWNHTHIGINYYEEDQFSRVPLF